MLADQSKRVDMKTDPANRIKNPNAQIGARISAYTRKRLITKVIPDEAIRALLKSYFFIDMNEMKKIDKMKIVAMNPPVESLA